MDIDEVVIKLQRSKNYMDTGAGNLSRWFRCSRQTIYDAKDIVRKKAANNRLVKVLVFDIETSPLLSFVYQKEVWKARVNNDKIVSDWMVLCWSAKWLGSVDILSDKITPKEVASENDSRVTKSLWNLFDEADILIAHNARGFDIPNMNTKFIVNGLNPPSPYKVIDTLDVARKQFGFTHNNLDYLCKLFGLPQKIKTDFSLWKGCMFGDQDSLDSMEAYNRGDVSILEELFLKLRPWIINHPNLSLYYNDNNQRCCNCGSPNVVKLDDKFYYTSVGKYEVYRCECGALSRGRKTVIGKTKNSITLTSVGK